VSGITLSKNGEEGLPRRSDASREGGDKKKPAEAGFFKKVKINQI